jgi:hypothetical protein
VGLTTISALFQRFFSGVAESCTMNAAPTKGVQATAATVPVTVRTGATAGGTADAVTAVPQPERGSDEIEHHLGRLDRPELGGTASATPPSRRIRWLP